MGAAGSGGAPGFDISPSPYQTETTTGKWVFEDDGDLILGSGNNGLAHSGGLSYTITVSSSLSVNIDMWGGGAGGGWYYTLAIGTGGPGGGGGHTTADVVLNPGTYIIWVGGGGKTFPYFATGPSSPARADYRSGGCPLTWGTEGAGCSGLFKGSATQANAMLIAGGGGGGGSPGYGSYGGAGGGSSGGNSNGGAQSGYGGSQTAGGAASPYNSSTAGSALSGGTSQTYGYSSLGGGGAGYYGGGGGNVGGGGGGSGYIDTNDSDITNEVTTAGSYNTPGDMNNSRRTTYQYPGGAAGSGSISYVGGAQGRVYMSVN